jgi:protein-S-isoprenylcysteine O-methyltransferase Ste14
VLFASLLLLLMFWQWRPMPTVIWHFENPVIATILNGLSLVGWIMVFVSSFLIDHFDLFGLRQVMLHCRGRQYTHPPFVVRSLYRWIRHPLMAGFLIAFWFTPTMTQGHLLFAVVTTGYIFFGIWIEERDLEKFLGEDYSAYRQRTAMIFPLPRK